MKYDYHVIIIGAGGAGLSAASGCAMLGARAVLIEKDKFGGECLTSGCVPSKALINGARIVSALRSCGEYGITAKLESVDLEKMMRHGDSAVDLIASRDSREKFEKMGVEVVSGEAVFEGPHAVRAGGRLLTGKYIVVASGSKPIVPPVPGLESVEYLTNETIFGLKKLPRRLIVFGGGPIGLEFGQTFGYLGSEVAIVDMLPHLFSKDDPEVAPVLEKRLQSEGIRLFLSSRILAVGNKAGVISVTIEKDGAKAEIQGDALLVALGRVPHAKGLGLEKAGVALDPRGYIKTGPDMRTNVSSIYACGDITGRFQFSHMAGYEAGLAVRNMLLPFPAKADYSNVPWVTYTSPEVAHTGLTEPAARAAGVFDRSVITNMELSDRAVLEFRREGFLKLVLGRGGRILGATIVCENAGEMIALASLAVERKMKGTAFYRMIMPYPTDSEIYRAASKELLKNSFKPWMKMLVRKLFL